MAGRMQRLRVVSGGERGIRTPGTLSGTAVFKTAAFDRSAISPRCGAGSVAPARIFCATP
jgi:hypothetical protein